MSDDKKSESESATGRLVESADFASQRSKNAEMVIIQPIAVQRLDPAPTSPPKKTSQGGGQGGASGGS